MLVIGCCHCSPLGIVTIGFGDGNHVGDFQNTFFDSLQFVAASSDHEHQKKIDHFRDGNFTLADPDSLDQDDVVARSFADQDGFTCRPRNPT